YSETLKVLSARRRMRVELPAPSHGDSRSTVSLREKKSGVVQETSTTAPKGSAELMWEAFHAFVEKGRQPVSCAAEARDQVVLLREVPSDIVVADGRSLEAEETATASDAAGPAEPAAADEAAPDGPAGEHATADDAAAGDATVGDVVGGPAVAAASGSEPAPETLEQPVQDTGAVGAATAPGADDEVTDAWGSGLAPADDPTAQETPAEGAPTGERPRPWPPRRPRSRGPPPPLPGRRGSRRRRGRSPRHAGDTPGRRAHSGRPGAAQRPPGGAVVHRRGRLSHPSSTLDCACSHRFRAWPLRSVAIRVRSSSACQQRDVDATLVVQYI